MTNDDIPTMVTTTMTKPDCASISDVVRVASVDSIAEPSKTILVATISTTIPTNCGKSIWCNSSSKTQQNHQHKQRMVRISILFISTLIIATIGHLYKSSITFDQFDIPDGSIRIYGGGDSNNDSRSNHDRINSNDTPTSSNMSADIKSTNVLSSNTNNDRAIRGSNAASKTVPHDELSHLSIEEYLIRKLPLVQNNKNDKINKKQTELLKKNLKFAYRDVTEMLDRSHRFPSIHERVKLYMSNWYIPPCSNIDARIVYQYSTNDDKISTSNMATRLLTIQETSAPAIIDNYNNSPQQQQQQQQQKQRVFVVNSHFDGTHDESFDEVHYMDRQLFVQNCTHKYCQDMVEFLLPALDRVQSQQQEPDKSMNTDYSNVPILYQFGDMHQTRATQFLEQKHQYIKHVRYPNLPVIQKVRMSKSPSNLLYITDDTKFQCYQSHERRGSVTALISTDNGNHNKDKNKNIIPLSSAHYEPIIFKLKTHRHYGGIYKVADADTIPWELKKNKAIFRGALTGLYPSNMKPNDVDQLNVQERCRLLPRCWFTYIHASSQLVDSKLTEPYAELKQIPRVMTVHEQTIDLYGSRMSIDELLQYKALILLEGNDVSSGLKWALFSNSIVMMPPPTLTSWAMEEMLQPWVHYVPIQIYSSNATNELHDEDTGIFTTTGSTTLTDAEEKMQWIMDNDDKAREIVRASTLWIADLVLHPDVPTDETSIFDEMIRRYLSHLV